MGTIKNLFAAILYITGSVKLHFLLATTAAPFGVHFILFVVQAFGFFFAVDVFDEKESNLTVASVQLILVAAIWLLR